ncbi:MAG: DUF58 domain-containing protein [Mariniblastus sp.]|nr:DUF58 domain-containing protein [Mariniblastus sp.]
MKLQKLKQTLLWVSRVANHDFCPNWNWLIHWIKRPLGGVVISILFSFLIGVFVGPQGYVMAFAFLTLLALGLTWPWLSMKGIRCDLILPDHRVEENQELVITFRVKNYWPLPVFGLMVRGDFLQESDEAESVAFSLKRVGAWSESNFSIPITPRRRGRLPNGDVSVASGFPFGLMDISKEVNYSQSALVWPSCVPLEGFPVSDSTRFCLQGALRDRDGSDGDSIGVRSYRIGDRLKNIHWAQSARSQKLMVRERQSITSTGATVVLHLSPGGYDQHGANSSFEWTIRIAASICSHLHETDSPVQVIAIGLHGQNRLCQNNRNGLRPIMDFLAKLPTLAEAMDLSAGQLSQPKHSLTKMIRGHLFAIGSSESMQTQSVGCRNLTSNVTPIIVDLDRLKSEGKLPSPLTTASSPRTSKCGPRNSSESIVIEATHAVPTELTNGWDRSFSDAV